MAKMPMCPEHMTDQLDKGSKPETARVEKAEMAAMKAMKAPPPPERKGSSMKGK